MFVFEQSICFIYRVLVFAYHVAFEQALLIQGWKRKGIVGPLYLLPYKVARQAVVFFLFEEGVRLRTSVRFR